MSKLEIDDDDRFLQPVPETGDDETGPYLCALPGLNTTDHQVQRALTAARELFDQAGRDPVTVAHLMGEQPGMKTLWDTAQRAADHAAGTHVKLFIFFE